MRQQNQGLIILVMFGGIFLGSPVFSYAQTDPNWQVGLSISSMKGDYNGDEDTSFFFFSTSIKRYLEKGDVTLTIPFLNVSEDTQYTGGKFEHLEGTEGSSGIGDITLKGRYYAVEQEGLLPFIDLVGSIKLPTGNEDDGLGTGETDFTFIAEFTRVMKNENWKTLAELGYTFVGEPSGYDVNNKWLYSIGLAYKLNEKVMLSGYLDGQTAIYSGNDDPLSILLGSEIKLRPDIRFDTSLEIGLNDGSPDYGITIGLRKRF